MTPLGTYIPSLNATKFGCISTKFLAVVLVNTVPSCEDCSHGLLDHISNNKKNEIMIIVFQCRRLPFDLELCFGDSGALYQFMVTVNLHPEGLESVIKYVHTFLLDFQARDTIVYAGMFCC